MYNNNPYSNPYLGYGQNGYNQQPMYNQPIQQNNMQQNSANSLLNSANSLQNSRQLQGKLVESIDVVKTMEIPLDGSISYFPTTDGTSIITKKLQNDGTSKITIYKPIEDEQSEKIEYITKSQLNEAIEKIDLSDLDDLKEDIRDIRKELKDIKSKK